MLLTPGKKKVDCHNIDVNGTSIEPQENVTYLGINIDKDLTFEKETNKVLQRMAMGIQTVNNIKRMTSKCVRKVLFESLIMSHFHYSAPFFVGLTEKLKNSLQQQQNWALKVCFSRSKSDHLDELMNTNNVLNIEALVKKKSLCIMYKNLQEPNTKQSIPTFDFSMNSRTENLSSRIKSNRKTFDNSFAHQVLPSWNALDRNVKIVKRYNRFKAELKKFLFKSWQKRPPDRIVRKIWADFKVD